MVWFLSEGGVLIHRTRTTMPTAPLTRRNGAFMRPSAWRRKDGGVADARDVRAVALAPAPGNFAKSCRSLCGDEARAHPTITSRLHNAT
jgi:hypothetical protein